MVDIREVLVGIKETISDAIQLSSDAKVAMENSLSLLPEDVPRTHTTLRGCDDRGLAVQCDCPWLRDMVW